MPISENIKSLRTSHKLSQSEFGKIAGVSDKAVSTWESGEKIPRMGAIQKIADYFGILKSDIIEEISTKQNIPALSLKEKQLMTYFNNYNDEGKEELLKYADYLSQKDEYKKDSDIQQEVG